MNLRLAALFLAGASFLAAQPPRPAPPIAWWENPVANGLDLTDAQKDSVNRIRKIFNERVVQKREAIDRAEAELDAIFNAPAIDWDKARVTVDQLAQARADLTRDVSIMMLRMRAVLTFDQWKTLEARRQTLQSRDPRGKGRGRGFPRGPGGPGGGGTNGPGFSETKQ
jgi:Spy/CpxP family protein refolding chaperone